MNTMDIMTLDEIISYKRKWYRRSYEVEFNESREVSAKEWCKNHVEIHRWHFVPDTDRNKCEILFERQQDAVNFKEYMNNS